MVEVVSKPHGNRRESSRAERQGRGQDRHRAMGAEEQGAHGGVVRGIRARRQAKYAFAAIYESDVSNAEVHGGTVAAPLIGKVLRELFKDEPKENSKKKKLKKVEEDEDAPLRGAEEMKQEPGRD